jgi:hypothetical protein
MTTTFKMPEKTHFPVDSRMGHTDEALKQALCDVLERAAQACDEVEKYPSLGPRHCAESIRAMIGKIK